MEVKRPSGLVPLGTEVRFSTAKVAATGGNVSPTCPIKSICLLLSASSYSNWTRTYVAASPLPLLCCASSQRRALELIYTTTGTSPRNKTQFHINRLPTRAQSRAHTAEEMEKCFLCFLQCFAQLILQGCMNWGRHKPPTVWYAAAQHDLSKLMKKWTFVITNTFSTRESYLFMKLTPYLQLCSLFASQNPSGSVKKMAITVSGLQTVWRLTLIHLLYNYFPSLFSAYGVFRTLWRLLAIHSVFRSSV